MTHRSRSLNPVWESVFYPKTEVSEENDLRVKLPLKKFCTGSEYIGEWKKIGMDGKGTFAFPHNVVYVGHLKDGNFHGEGMVQYPQGNQIEGVWRKGHLIEYKYRFPDGLCYYTPWKYCKDRDRRFHISILHGLKGTPEENRTNDPVPRKIPPGMYDTVDGFYDPALKCVVSARDLKKVLRIVTSSEEKWTIEHCRKAWDENVGYNPNLYEKWTTGYHLELDTTDSESSTKSPPDISPETTHS